jgi:hypothetical protein
VCRGSTRHTSPGASRAGDSTEDLTAEVRALEIRSDAKTCF